MCLIVQRNKVDTHIPDNIIDYNLRTNPDGFGIAWREPDGELRVEKFGPEDAASFRQLLKEIDSDSSIEYVAHFRKATHGPACERLAHPFEYEDPEVGKVLLFHNGVIPIKTQSSESDTSTFVDRIVSKLPSRWWHNEAIVWLVEESISWSRLLVMTQHEALRFTGSNPWTNLNGVWYSVWPGSSHNTSSKDDDKSKSKTNEKPKSVSSQPVRSGSETLLLPEGTKTVVKKVTSATTRGEGWMHAGHWVERLDRQEASNFIDFGDEDDDDYGLVRCTICGTLGEYIQIEGKPYIDVNHSSAIMYDENEDDAEYARWMADEGDHGLLPGLGVPVLAGSKLN